eukprot:COSAG05_NODE_792_length_7316_cov_31.215325_2_plen_174_part_00
MASAAAGFQCVVGEADCGGVVSANGNRPCDAMPIAPQVASVIAGPAAELWLLPPVSPSSSPSPPAEVHDAREGRPQPPPVVLGLADGQIDPYSSDYPGCCLQDFPDADYIAALADYTLHPKPQCTVNSAAPVLSYVRGSASGADGDRGGRWGMDRGLALADANGELWLWRLNE